MYICIDSGVFLTLQAEVEVERLDVLKASKMKELVVKKRMELEDVCRNAHLEPDVNTTEDKLCALIDSGRQTCDKMIRCYL